MQNFDLIVAGAGIVGMSTALWARKDGMRVLLCDGNLPGSGTTSGSACTIATYASVPINSPSIPASLPRLLTRSDSPLSFDWKYGLRNPRWMLSFLSHCRASKVRHISSQLGLLLSHANSSLDEMISECSADDLIVDNDCMYIWSTEAGFDAALGGIATQRANGVALELLTADEARDLEPSLKGKIHKGLKFNGARHVLNPQELVIRMHRRFLELGGKWIQDNVRTVVPDKAGVTVALENDDTVSGDYFALAAGAFSTRIRGTGAEYLPLGVERGYSIVYPGHGAITSRPVGWAEAGLYATPMAQGLRFAGTVEIASLDAPSNPRNIDYLHKRSLEMFGPLGAPEKPWLGYRPTLPDSLPVIGPSPKSERVIFAFGHQHVGLTLGPVTGRIVSELVRGKLPHFDISGLTPRRFWS
ncbi:NAD(P)/FAD-dependent oxidoreductase [Roseovarius confluentis]|uniref:NAD(P)/FAD-dependent oxidoreductase n=1 Tax=Roseovarius confluentis TaxID=1852027 RepID=UPI000CDD2A8B|nr:FAD-binding oxidoreductase [Roseovarius confluentis]